MIVGVPTERAPGEHRVALTPDAVQRLAQRDLTVLLEPGAGAGASLLDDAYREAGAEIASSVEDVYARADIVVRIGRVEPAEVAALRSGTVLVGYLRPLTDPELVQALTSAGVTGFSMEAVPRVTRAQRMDLLSSQATVSGYRAVILAAEALPKFFPMLMTAAGTIAPAKVLMLGAGVAGLQAIATARRLGAVVEAFDVRKVVKEQVESLGAKFVELEMEMGEAQAAGGYASELSESRRRSSSAPRAPHRRPDVVITTALVPGAGSAAHPGRHGRADADRLRHRRPGRRDRRELRAHRPGRGRRARRHDHRHPQPAAHAAAREPDVLAKHRELLFHLIEDGALTFDFDDEIVADAVITHDGRVTSRLVQEAPA